MKITPIILTCILGAFFTGCGIKSGKGYSQEDLSSSKWLFIGIRQNDTGIIEKIPENLKGMSATFTKPDQFNATSSCNTFYGIYKTSGSNSIKIENLSMTKMFCADEPVLTWETRYFDGFKNSDKFEFKSDSLFIGTTSSVDLIFKAE